MSVASLFTIIAFILFFGVLGEIIFKKTNIPDVIWLIIIGIIIGPVLNLINASSLWGIAPFFAAIALIIILFDGGLHLKLYKLIKELPLVFALAITSYVISGAAIALTSLGFASLGFLPGWTVPKAILIGSILGGTSSIVIIPLLKNLLLKEEIKSILKIESAITDALAVVVAITIIQFIALPNIGLQEIITMISSSFAIGIVLGFISGIIWLYILKLVSNNKHHYMLTFAFLLLLYSLVDFIGGSAAMSILIFGIVLGNGKKLSNMLKFKEELVLSVEISEFHEQVSFFIKTFFFAFIGLLLIAGINELVIGFTFASVIIITRIISVRLSTYKKIKKEEKQVLDAFVARGLAAAVLAVIPISYGIQGTQIFVGITFTTILFTIIICAIGVYIISKERIGFITKINNKHKKRHKTKKVIASSK